MFTSMLKAPMSAGDKTALAIISAELCRSTYTSADETPTPVKTFFIKPNSLDVHDEHSQRNAPKVLIQVFGPQL
jgi:hypothetical protein